MQPWTLWQFRCPSLPSVWDVPQVVPCLVPWPGAPHSPTCILRRGAPTPPLCCGSLAGYRVLLHPTGSCWVWLRQGWGCRRVMPGSAQPGSLILVQLQILSQHLLQTSFLLHCFSGSFNSLFLISRLLFNLINGCPGIPSEHYQFGA